MQRKESKEGKKNKGGIKPKARKRDSSNSQSSILPPTTHRVGLIASIFSTHIRSPSSDEDNKISAEFQSDGDKSDCDTSSDRKHHTKRPGICWVWSENGPDRDGSYEESTILTSSSEEYTDNSPTS